MKKKIIFISSFILITGAAIANTVFADGAGFYPGDSSGEVMFTGASSSHYLLLSSGGVVSALGDNEYGQCGTMPSSTQSDISYIDFKTKITKVSAGKNFSMALDETGEAYGWGNNTVSQLAHHADTSAMQFSEPVKMGVDIADIAAGDDFSVMLDTDGRILISGTDRSYVMKTADILDDTKIYQIAAGYNNIVAAGENNTVYWLTPDGDNLLTAEMPQGISVNSMAVGREHIVLLCDDEENEYIYTWGSNEKYQIGDPDIKEAATPVNVLTIPKSEYQHISIYAGEYSVIVNAWNNLSFYEGAKEYSWGTGLFEISEGRCESEPVMSPEESQCYYQMIALGADKYMAYDYLNCNVMLCSYESGNIVSIPLLEYEDDVKVFLSYAYDSTAYQSYKLNFVKLNEERFDDENKLVDESTGEYTDKYFYWEYVDEHHFKAKIKSFTSNQFKDMGIVKLSKEVSGESREIFGYGPEIWNFRVGNIVLDSNVQTISYGNEDGTIIPITAHRRTYGSNREIKLPADIPVFYEEPGEITEETPLGLYIYGLPEGVKADVVWNENENMEIRLSGNSSVYNGGETYIKYSLINIWDSDKITGKIGDYELGNTLLNISNSRVLGFSIDGVNYDITDLRLFSEIGYELDFIPNGDFVAEVKFRKSGDDETKDTFIIAMYDVDGNLIYMDSLTARFAENYDYKYGFAIPYIRKNIASIKVFVWDDLESMKILGRVSELINSRMYY